MHERPYHSTSHRTENAWRSNMCSCGSVFLSDYWSRKPQGIPVLIGVLLGNIHLIEYCISVGRSHLMLVHTIPFPSTHVLIEYCIIASFHSSPIRTGYHQVVAILLRG